MKKNNYYIGLLAGVLTIGLQQESGAQGISGQMMFAKQTTNDLEALEIAASELAAIYDERAGSSTNKAVRRLFRIRAKLLRTTFGVENAPEHPEADFNNPLGKIRQDYAKQLAAYYTQNGNPEFARDLRNDFAWLGTYATQIAGMKLESNDDVQNLRKGSLIFKSRVALFINNAPIRNQADANLYHKLETQQIFSPDDFVVDGMYQYIIVYPVRADEIENWVAELSDKHNGTAEKPIVFQAQKFNVSSNFLPVQEREDFEIKTYWCDINTGHPRQSNQKYFNALKNCNKPIIFGKTQRDLELSTGITVRHYEREVNYRNYLQLVQTYGNDFFVEFVSISPTSMQALQQQLDVLINNKSVGQIYIDCSVSVDATQIPLEYLGCVKIRQMSFSNYQNPNDELFLIRTELGKLTNVKCKTIYCFDYPVGENAFIHRIYDRMSGGNVHELQGNLRFYIDHFTKETDMLLREKERAYFQYIKRYDLEYLSGYVNIKNKPEDLSDEEWQKVVVLKRKAEEIKALMPREIPRLVIKLPGSGC